MSSLRSLNKHLSAALLFGPVIALLTACGPTGNRLNIGVINDPRTQFDPNSTTGNQGTVVPTNPGANASVVDPSLTVPSTGGGGTNTSSNSNQQTSGSAVPGGVFSLSASGTASIASSPSWMITIGADGGFVLRHRAAPYGAVDLQLNGTRTIQADGSLVFTVLDRQGEALPDIRSGTTILGVVWTNHLIVLGGSSLSGRGMIALSVDANCPSADIDGIWLDNTETDRSLTAGTLNYTTSMAAAAQTVAIDTLTGQALPGRSFTNGACGTESVLGLMSASPVGNTAYVSLSSAGVGVLSDGTTEALTLPMPTPLTLGALTGDFVALSGASNNDAVVSFHCNDLGQCSADEPSAIQLYALNPIANGTATGQYIGPDGIASPIACISAVSEPQLARVDLLSCRTASALPENIVLVRKTAP
ncbi:MAG: hypothetical protein GC138_10055 [Gammaproteobacteria bacterium]|nr:hypothetical protein [Gammaproteobacteria bacterium]